MVFVSSKKLETAAYPTIQQHMWSSQMWVIFENLAFFQYKSWFLKINIQRKRVMKLTNNQANNTASLYIYMFVFMLKEGRITSFKKWLVDFPIHMVALSLEI